MILHISRLFNKITTVLYEIKYGFQRMFRHYDDRDSWDVGYSVLKLMEYNIPKMRKSKNFGRPSCFETIEDWEEILDTIYLGVQSAIKVYDGDFNSSREYKDLDSKAYEGLKLFAQYYYHLWD